MGRRRLTDRHLPERVYFRRGQHFYVDRAGKWHALGKDYAKALGHLSVLLDVECPAETLQQLYERYELQELRKKAAKTQRGRRQELKPILAVFGAMSPEAIESHHVWNYFEKRGRTEQARHEVRALSALLTYARRVGARKALNPCHKLQLPGSAPRARYVTDEEFWRVHDLAPPMIQGAMKLALLAGMDGATIRSLQRSNLTDEGICFTRTKLMREDRGEPKLQLVEWSDELRTVAKELLTLPPQVRQHLVATRRGRPYTLDGFQAQWQRVMRKAIKAGVARFHFHDLRAKSASDAQSLQEATERLGHASPETTKRFYRRLPQRSQALKSPQQAG